MSVSAAPLPHASSNNHDPALKPNPHPYAIKTTHTGILSRSNSSGHNTPSEYFYTPPAGTPSHSPTKPGHRHSASLTSELPLPLPSPLASPAHSQRSQSEDDLSLRRQRADTLPTYLVNIESVSAEPEGDLPRNPKTWTPSQLSVYLTTALRVRSGARLPERVARDITLWVRREFVSGRTFLRWTDEDLKVLGVNTLWRGALLAAARNLRQNMLRGRIWGSPTSEHEPEEEDGAPFGSYAFPSSSPDLTPADAKNADADTGGRTRRITNSNGHVRGIVDKWERESASSSRSSSRSSSHRRSESELELELASDAGDVCVVPTAANGSGALLFPSKENAIEEPSIEDLLATTPAPMDGSWGARAWEDLDVGTTMRRVDIAHDTIVPRRDGSGGGSGMGSVRSIALRKNGSGGGNNGSQRVRRTVVDVFAEPVDDDPFSALTVDVGVQVDACPPAEIEDTHAAEADAGLEARERALEDEVRGTRALLEEFRRRLEEVEARVGAMGAERLAKEERLAREAQVLQQRVALSTHNDKAVDAVPEEPHVAPEFSDDLTTPLPQSLPKVILVPSTATKETSETSDTSCTGDDADSERSVFRRPVGFGPETVSDLPSYVFLVGIGVCTVVLQVVLKRVAGRSLKP